MGIPGFTGELSIGTSVGRYVGRSLSSSSSAGALPQLPIGGGASGSCCCDTSFGGSWGGIAFFSKAPGRLALSRALGGFGWGAAGQTCVDCADDCSICVCRA
jgi:hypothetical protein